MNGIISLASKLYIADLTRRVRAHTACFLNALCKALVDKIATKLVAARDKWKADVMAQGREKECEEKAEQ